MHKEKFCFQCLKIHEAPRPSSTQKERHPGSSCPRPSCWDTVSFVSTLHNVRPSRDRCGRVTMTSAGASLREPPPCPTGEELSPPTPGPPLLRFPGAPLAGRPGPADTLTRSEVASTLYGNTL